ncbi:hypothetical protein GpartN1_g627.t1 [Galdieria partita]|uniref:Alpha-xylosidase n=1 Tax=Galdieria partita TaxID=83374 RepID=A0A9C7PS44_9RHOD|nr:hypothetical protein GpartN1_g627.t1 [Galdieria partita]
MFHSSPETAWHPDLSKIERARCLAPLVGDRGNHLKTNLGDLSVQFIDSSLIRLSLGTVSLVNYGLVREDLDSKAVNPQWYSVDEQWIAESDSLVVGLDQNSSSLSFYKDSKLRIMSPQDASFVSPHRIPPLGLGIWQHRRLWSFALGLESGEPVYGLGEKWSSLNKRGQWISSDNRDAVGVNAEWSYKNCPFLWSTKGWGILFHTPNRVYHAVGYPQYSHRSYIGFVEEDSALDIFIFLEENCVNILQKYSWLTGKTPQLPLWGLGIWISRAWYKNEQEIVETATRLRNKHFPSDVFLLDGRTWLDTLTRFAFEWDRSRYPNPAQLIETLHHLNFRVACWEYPLISIYHPWFVELARKEYLLKDKASGETLIYVWPRGPFSSKLPPLPNSGILDFTNPKAYQAWCESHKRLFDMGVDVMKTDFGEQIEDRAVAFNGDSGERLHNVYPLLYNRCVYEATKLYGNPRNGAAMVFGRSGWISSQCYPTQWGGDPQADWGGLEASIRGGLSWGMSGGTCYATDIGGFYSREHYLSSQLFLRWTQAAIYSSHMRFHGLGPSEPWIFEQVEDWILECMKWRYRLLIYLEFCLEEARHLGLPVMRALPLMYHEDVIGRQFELEFLFGPCVLVSPVTSPQDEVTFYMPDDSLYWYDWWSGERFQGGQILTRKYSWREYPLLMKEGTMLFLGPEVESTRAFENKENDWNTRVQELHVFGLPDIIALPKCMAEQLQLEKEDNRVIVKSLPENISVITHGPIKMERERTTTVFEKV